MNSGLVVMGGDWRSRGCGFESHHQILDVFHANDGYETPMIMKQITNKIKNVTEQYLVLGRATVPITNMMKVCDTIEVDVHDNLQSYLKFV